MRSDLIVVSTPSLDLLLGVVKSHEPVGVQAFVAEFPVEIEHLRKPYFLEDFRLDDAERLWRSCQPDYALPTCPPPSAIPNGNRQAIHLNSGGNDPNKPGHLSEHFLGAENVNKR